MVVARVVMAVAGMTAGDKNRVSANLEGLNQQVKVDTAGAGKAHDSHIRGILQAGGAGEIRTQVGTPVADKGDDTRFEGLAHASASTIE